MNQLLDPGSDVPAWSLTHEAGPASSDRGIRYADKFIMNDGWVYKAVGNWHPDGAVFAEPDWSRASKSATRGQSHKVRDLRDGNVEHRPRYPTVPSPLPGRAFELLPDDEISEHVLPESAAGRILRSPGSALGARVSNGKV